MIHEAFPYLTETASDSHPCCVVSVTYDRPSYFHGGNTGSNPVGDANKIKDLSETSFFAGDTVGTHKFYPLVFSPSRNIATTFPWARRLADVIACA